MNHLISLSTFGKPYPFGSCSINQIEELETEYSVKIPNDYKDYLYQFNGSKPKNIFCHLNDDEGGTVLHHMYGLHNGEEYNRVKIKEKMLIFADDTFGNEFGISLNNDEYYGSIYFIDHEVENEKLLINQSFSDFITSLISEEKYIDNLKQEYPEIYARMQEFKRNPQI